MSYAPLSPRQIQQLRSPVLRTVYADRQAQVKRWLLIYNITPANRTRREQRAHVNNLLDECELIELELIHRREVHL